MLELQRNRIDLLKFQKFIQQDEIKRLRNAYFADTMRLELDGNRFVNLGDADASRDAVAADVVRGLSSSLAGGGGWGDPLDRDPDHVLRDVRDELVSITSAESDYGVIINACSMTVDEKATSSLREEMRAKRTSSKPSFVSWDDNGTEKALEAAE